ncbi:MAG: hypothetical protein FWF34_02145, partial [Alphaproteobacteria bacterium]|nr:hypothetical protein [Alphaproteobacteria bacterium]
GLGALVAGGGGSGTGTTTPTTLTAPPVASVVTTSEIAAPAPETVRTETLLLPLQPGHFRTEQECRNAIIGQAGKTCLFSSPTDSWRIADQSETDTINQRNADDRSAEQQRLERAAAAQGVHVNTIIQREQRQQDLDAAAAERELSAQRPGAVVAESACTALPNGRFTQNRNGNYNCTFSHGPAHPCVATAIPSNNLFNVTRANSTMVACTLAIEIN